MAASMTTGMKTSALMIGAAIGLVCASLSDAQAQSRYGHQVQPQPHAQHQPHMMRQAPTPQQWPATHQQPVPHRQPVTGRYGVQTQQFFQPRDANRKYGSVMDRLLGRKRVEHQVPHVPLGLFQQWVEWEPQYTLVPGDQLDIVVGSAPELSRTLTVGPDGRVVMPMSAPIMAAGKTFNQLQTALMAELGKQLRDPRVSVTPRAYAPEEIYVGGQVGQPGTYTLNNRIGALEAILMAGGLRPTAKGKEVAILRRAPNGGMMLRTVNIRGGIMNIHEYNDTIQLRRGDIVFVPTSNIGEVGQFMQNFRNALPVDFNLSYQFGGGGNGGTTVISP